MFIREIFAKLEWSETKLLTFSAPNSSTQTMRSLGARLRRSKNTPSNVGTIQKVLEWREGTIMTDNHPKARNDELLILFWNQGRFKQNPKPINHTFESGAVTDALC